MNIKMIVTDLDGTFLREDKTVSDYTRAVFARCREAGIKIAYATGRGGSAERVAPPGLFDGKIIMNGAVARIDDEIVYSRLIPHETARPFLMTCHERGINITSEITGMHYSNFVVSDFWPEITHFQIVDFARHEIDAEKIYTLNPSPENKYIIEQSLPDGLHSVMSSDGLGDFLQIMHKDASKSKAVMELAKIWGIDKSKVVAFGNDFNDVDMLAHAGIGVAVANAFDDVKSAANYICDTNDNDGVAKWIDENILGGFTKPCQST